MTQRPLPPANSSSLRSEGVSVHEVVTVRIRQLTIRVAQAQKNLNPATVNWSNEPAVFALNPADLQNETLLPRTNSNAFFRLAAP